MPDLFLRMSATTKAATLGVGFVLLGTAIQYWDIGILSRAIVIISFLLVTAPVAAHMIGRAAYFDGVPLWKKTIVDELKGKYDEKTHNLDS
jgi:multicomponent Na+:H+ antiporter subunit G